MSNLTIAIERLQGPANYGSWRLRMKLYLKSQALWSVVEPAEDAAVDAVQDAKALNVLAQHVSDHLLADIGEADHASDAWETLESMFQAATQVRQLDLRRELTALTKSKSESIQQFISRTKQLAGDLKTAGGTLDDIELVHYVAGALHRTKEFTEPMGTTEVAAQVTHSELSLETVESVMLRAEAAAARARHHRGDGEGLRAVAMAMHPGNAAPVGAQRMHHYATKPSPTAAGREQGVCHFCGAPGHYKRDCKFKRWQEEQRRRQRQPGGAPNGDGPAARANVTSAIAFGASDNTFRTCDWLLDSGASVHITNNKLYLSDYTDFAEQQSVTFGNGSSLPAPGSGSVTLHLEEGYGTLQLQEVWLVPDAIYNFISLRRAARANIDFSTRGGNAFLSRNGLVLAEAYVGPDELYYLHPRSVGSMRGSPSTVVAAAAQPTDAKGAQDAALLHERYGHLSYSAIASLLKHNYVDGITVTADAIEAAARQPCEVCIMSKLTKNYSKPMASSAPSVTGPLDLIHMDVMGSIQPESLGGARYLATVMDEHSRYAEVFPISYKSDTAAAMIAVIKRWETALGRKVKVVRSDRGGEYVGRKLQDFFTDSGITHQLTAPYSPEQNGTIERFNRTLQERTRAMLLSSGLPKSLWAEAVHTVAYLHNVGDARLLAQTPWEGFYGVRPNISHLRVFGSMAYPRIPERYRDSKVGPVAWQGYMVGYEGKAYRIYLPDDEAVIISKDVRFIEQTGRKRARNLADSDSDSSQPEFRQLTQPYVPGLPLEEDVAYMPYIPIPAPSSSDQDAGSSSPSSAASSTAPPSSPDSAAEQVQQQAEPRRSTRLATQPARPPP